MARPTARDMDEGRRLFAHHAEFIWGSQTPGEFPNTAFPEVAFVGRSNVGKSSLLNALAGQKNLARVSKTPGRTQQFNFFNLADRLMLVDMPGYGYAAVGKKLEKIWSDMADSYFRGRDQLRRVFVLVDGRHGLKDHDVMLLDWLDRLVVPYQIILTKMDKVTEAEAVVLRDTMSAQIARHGAAQPDILETSVEAKKGIDELRAVIASLRG
jgi:GTP-binding protein